MVRIEKEERGYKGDTRGRKEKEQRDVQLQMGKRRRNRGDVQMG